jgi:DNA-binding SARP family transcriptional activator
MPEPTLARLDLQLFGGFTVTLEGAPVTAFDSDKVRALLSYLAVEADHAHSRDTLAALLWSDYVIAYAKAHCVLRELTAEERQTYGLSPQPTGDCP